MFYRLIDIFILINNLCWRFRSCYNTSLLGLITYLISKDLEKTITYTKRTLKITIILIVFILFANLNYIF